MKLEITQKKQNTLLNRVEVEARIDFDVATPSNSEVAAAIGKQVKGEVVVKSIYTTFGQKTGTVTAFVYKNLEDKSKMEKMTKHLRKKAEEVAKKVAEEKKAAAEAKKVAEEAAKKAANEATSVENNEGSE